MPHDDKKWTVDELGCTVLQLPVQWQVSSTLSGPMEVVPDFTVPTLGATFYFDEMWTGNGMFIFSYSSILVQQVLPTLIYGQNPGALIRNLQKTPTFSMAHLITTITVM